jgi:hypothetical protein
MRIASLFICAALAFSSGHASADPAISFGGAVPGQSIDEIVHATRFHDWRYFTDKASGELVGAVASDAAELDGWRWTMRLGKTSDIGPDSFSYSFEVHRMWRFDHEGECFTQLSRTITALEASLGAYAPGAWSDMEPSFAYLDGRLRPRETAAGALSRVRIYARERSKYFFAVRDISMGAATRATVIGINTHSRALVGWGYDCSISIGFKAPERPDGGAPPAHE